MVAAFSYEREERKKEQESIPRAMVPGGGGEEEGGPTGGMRVRGSRGVTGKARRSKLVGGRTKNTADRHRHK